MILVFLSLKLILKEARVELHIKHSESIDEVEDVGNDFRNTHDYQHVSVTDTFVEVVLDHCADNVSSDFTLGHCASSVVRADEKTDRDILNDTQVIQFSGLLVIKGIERPVLGRIPLESILLCVLGVVVHGICRDVGQSCAPATGEEFSEIFDAHQLSHLDNRGRPGGTTDFKDTFVLYQIDSGGVEDYFRVRLHARDRAGGKLHNLVGALLEEVILQGKPSKDLCCSH